MNNTTTQKLNLIVPVPNNAIPCLCGVGIGVVLLYSNNMSINKNLLQKTIYFIRLWLARRRITSFILGFVFSIYILLYLIIYKSGWIESDSILYSLFKWLIVFGLLFFPFISFETSLGIRKKAQKIIENEDELIRNIRDSYKK